MEILSDEVRIFLKYCWGLLLMQTWVHSPGWIRVVMQKAAAEEAHSVEIPNRVKTPIENVQCIN